VIKEDTDVFWVILNEIRVYMRLRTGLILLFAQPLLLIFILGSALSQVFQPDDVELQPVRVVIWTEDTSSLSSQTEQFFSTMVEDDILRTNSVNDRSTLLTQLRNDDADFGVIIPANFSSQVAAGEEATWELVLGRDQMANQIGTIVMNRYLAQVNALQATVLTSGQPSTPVTLTEKPASPDYVQIGSLGESGTKMSAMQYYAAMMLVMFLLYSGMAAGISIANEKQSGTLERLLAMPIRPFTWLAGKLIGNTLLAIAQIFVVIGFTAIVYGVEWGNVWGAVAICILVVWISMLLAVIITRFAGNERSVTAIFNVVIVAMTFVSGGFTPQVVGLMGGVETFTINYWATDGLMNIMYDGTWAVASEQFTILAIIGLGLTGIAILVLRRGKLYA
jgi:ABC-2 type transport system permease protein